MKLQVLALLIDQLVDALEAHYDGRAARNYKEIEELDKELIAQARKILELIQKEN